ncbi:hypothetical protein MML48_2g00002815 [Holotrichia oblita]|uniref:Uncharacterized protein n=1 Tax=Holotrichia oblita TaxID=644536 RepID=A0ACB9TIT0_HOLOL|nr:hypothetical protein MML48_2g00002815 [Holotrichia oblita]
MPDAEVSVTEDVIATVDKIIDKYGLKNITDIKYQVGSQAGDGYVSKTAAVDIINGNNTTTKVFLKYAQDVKSTESVPIDKLYANEIYFYDIVYPEFQKFLEKKHLKDAFRQVPKCYATSEKGGIVALENIKDKGFELYNRKVVMDHQHLELVLKTFAKFHALSFAFKDQEKKKYQELIDNSHGDFFSKIMEAEGPVKMITMSVNNFLEKLDPIRDKHILDKCQNLSEVLIKAICSPRDYLNEYSILTQGDCWCNNMMFKYPAEGPKHPTDIMLIDWQLLRQALPVFDISYFFYTIASEEALNNLDNYLRIYHKELCKRMRDLGSDPDILYPFKILQQDWKQHGKYGFAMSFMLIRMMLSATDEVVSMEGVDFDNAEDCERMYPKIKNEDEFIRRMKILAEHVIKNEFL